MHVEGVVLEACDPLCKPFLLVLSVRKHLSSSVIERLLMRKDPNREKRVRSPDQTRTRVLAAEIYCSIGIDRNTPSGEKFERGLWFWCFDGIWIWNWNMETKREMR